MTWIGQKCPFLLFPPTQLSLYFIYHFFAFLFNHHFAFSFCFRAQEKPKFSLFFHLFFIVGHKKMLRDVNCRDPSSWEHVPRTSWWHMARITIRITPIRIHVMRPSYPDWLKEVQTTLINIDIWTAFTIHPYDQHRSSGYDCPGHWLK